MSHISEAPDAFADTGKAVTAPVVDNSLAIAKAREHGWVETSDIQYDGFASQPSWASNAQVYEFRGEEGEVGPINEALEKQLFGAKTRSRAGDSLKALDLTVTCEGPTQIKPARNVSGDALSLCANSADQFSVRRSRSSPHRLGERQALRLRDNHGRAGLLHPCSPLWQGCCRCRSDRLRQDGRVPHSHHL